MDALCVGEILIDWVCPERGATLAAARTFHPTPGGAPANVAVGLARLGMKAGFAGSVAEDPWGAELLKRLEHEQVDVRAVIRDAEADTRMAYVLLNEKGERELAAFSRQAADARLAAADVAALPLAGVKIVYLSSMMQATPVSREAFQAVLAKAREAGCLIVYDPNYRPFLWKDEAAAREALESGAEACDLLKLSSEELAFLSGTMHLREGMAKVWERFEPALLVVTDGPMGCFWKNQASEGHIQAIPVPVLDPTGAGDGFVAGLVAGILEEGPDREIVRWLPEETVRPLLRRANGVGALVTTKLGAMTALPTREELDAWLLNCEG